MTGTPNLWASRFSGKAADDHWHLHYFERMAPERRAKQAELIRTWRPCERSTGPRTLDGKAKASRNAYKGGHCLMLRELSRLVNA